MDLERAFIDHPLGEKLEIVVRRGASSKGEGGDDVRAELVLRTAEKAPSLLPNDLVWKKLGIKLQPAPVELVQKANPQLHGGLMVMEIDNEGLASRAGFQRGDILIGLHQWETVSVDNISYVLNHPDVATFSPIRYFRIRAGQLQRGWLASGE
jgi:serine protease Do